MSLIHLYMVLCPVFVLVEVEGFSSENKKNSFVRRERRYISPNKCDLDDSDACGHGYCCIKEVISFQDLDMDPRASTLCHPHLTLGQLCLRQTEGYLCDCAHGLKCDFRNNETYGHCIQS